LFLKLPHNRHQLQFKPHKQQPPLPLQTNLKKNLQNIKTPNKNNLSNLFLSNKTLTMQRLFLKAKKLTKLARKF
jgi:hypothetical protein